MTPLFNFGYDIIDQNALKQPNRIAVSYRSMLHKIDITCDELRHHSDITANYLRRVGVMPQTPVLVAGMEHSFELALILGGLSKLGAIAIIPTTDAIVEACNSCQAYAAIVRTKTVGIEALSKHVEALTSVELRIAIGEDCPNGWFDFHTGVRSAGVFKRKPLQLPDDATLLTLYDGTPHHYPLTYPQEAKQGMPWDDFFYAQIHQTTWVVAP